ncbi:unnamed protein product [Staurois parvus]|uniref:Uncharacterized protein n=1 Tax=Staurois parvus TaxID=386267 RepID=A0ABN9GGR5_9NEOB|nr:unnamed protein product [Staurois parvus]
MKDRSCQTNLIVFYEEVNKTLDREMAVDVVYLDREVAVDVVYLDREGWRWTWYTWTEGWL